MYQKGFTSPVVDGQIPLREVREETVECICSVVLDAHESKVVDVQRFLGLAILARRTTVYDVMAL